MLGPGSVRLYGDSVGGEGGESVGALPWRVGRCDSSSLGALEASESVGGECDPCWDEGERPVGYGINATPLIPKPLAHPQAPASHVLRAHGLTSCLEQRSDNPQQVQIFDTFSVIIRLMSHRARWACVCIRGPPHASKFPDDYPASQVPSAPIRRRSAGTIRNATMFR